MTPPLDIVLSRRHAVLIAVRFAAAALLALGLLTACRSIARMVPELLGGSLFMTKIVYVNVLFDVSAAAPFLLPGVLLAWKSPRLAAWIVPPGLRLDGCPNCGYSLKNLKSPICPECGSDIGPRANARSWHRPSGR